MNNITLSVDFDDQAAVNKAINMLKTLVNSELAPPYSYELPEGENLSEISKEPFVESVENLGLTSVELPPNAIVETQKQHDQAINGSVELDSAGRPWDHRINSSSRKKTAKEGIWKLARNIDKTLVQQVYAELDATMKIQAPPATPTAPTAPTAEQVAQTPSTSSIELLKPVTPPPPPAPEPVQKYLVEGKEYTADELRGFDWTEAHIAQAEKIPLTPSAPVQTETVTQLTFPEFMAKITKAQSDGIITEEQINVAVQSVGLTSRPLLAAKPDLIPAVDKALFG